VLLLSELELDRGGLHGDLGSNVEHAHAAIDLIEN
jgi:hypothetical protein